MLHLFFCQAVNDVGMLLSDFIPTRFQAPKRKLSAANHMDMIAENGGLPILMYDRAVQAVQHLFCNCIDLVEVVGFITKFVAMLIYLMCAVGCWVYLFQGIRAPSLQQFTSWITCSGATLSLRNTLKKTMQREMKQVLEHAEVFIATSLIMVVGANLAFVLHTPMKEPLADIGFLLLPEIEGPFSNLSDLLTAICPILYALHTAGMTRKERCRVFVSFFRIMSICYGLRTFTVPLTSLPGPATHCRLDAVNYHPPTDWIDVVTRIGPMHGQFNTCGDLLFSGHMCYTNVALLLYLRNLDQRWPHPKWLHIRWIVASLYLLVVALLCIAARKHYTVDVVLGILISSLIFFHFEHGWKPHCIVAPPPSNITTLVAEYTTARQDIC